MTFLGLNQPPIFYSELVGCVEWVLTANHLQVTQIRLLSLSGSSTGSAQPLELSPNQLTISLCSHGCTGDTVTHSILSPHPHIVLSGGNEAMQSHGGDIVSDHLHLK